MQHSKYIKILFITNKKSGKVVAKSNLQILFTLKNLTMKKVLFSAAVVLGAIAVSVSNFGTSNAQVPTTNHSYILKDTVPSDTTKPKDSSLVKF